jgi:hypothetical protein
MAFSFCFSSLIGKLYTTLAQKLLKDSASMSMYVSRARARAHTLAGHDEWIGHTTTGSCLLAGRNYVLFLLLKVKPQRRG